MYYLEGSSAVLRNAAVLSRPYIEDLTAVSQESLRTAYLRYLADLARPGDYSDWLDLRAKEYAAGEQQATLFLDRGRETNVLGEIFGNPAPADIPAPAGNFAPTSATAPPPHQLAKCRQGADFVAERDAELASFFSLLTHTVFTLPTSWAGSMSDRNAIGATLLVPAEHWHENDVAEGLIHEFTHTALFLDERVKGHFRAGADEVLLDSAIRKDERTLPAVVHSLLVATEILSWRQAQGLWDGLPFHLHGSSLQMLEKARESHRSLVSLPDWRDVVKDRMYELVDKAGQRLALF